MQRMQKFLICLPVLFLFISSAPAGDSNLQVNKEWDKKNCVSFKTLVVTFLDFRISDVMGPRTATNCAISLDNILKDVPQAIVTTTHFEKVQVSDIDSAMLYSRSFTLKDNEEEQMRMPNFSKSLVFGAVTPDMVLCLQNFTCSEEQGLEPSAYGSSGIVKVRKYFVDVILIDNINHTLVLYGYVSCNTKVPQYFLKGQISVLETTFKDLSGEIFSSLPIYKPVVRQGNYRFRH
jgi:hypothetical protein